uniref:Uncharacterized protein n=1 Tax=Octopus bimaculoides TaxID=37653 RepID=A0A0L8FZG7_OCTBM
MSSTLAGFELGKFLSELIKYPSCPVLLLSFPDIISLFTTITTKYHSYNFTASDDRGWFIIGDRQTDRQRSFTFIGIFITFSDPVYLQKDTKQQSKVYIFIYIYIYIYIFLNRYGYFFVLL